MTITTISPSITNASANRSVEIAKSVYQADQQVKFLDLHANAESLLQQLQAIKQQREVSTGPHH